MQLSSVSELNHFIDADPSHKDLVARVVERNSVQRDDLSVPRLKALLTLEADLGAKSENLAELLVRERQGTPIRPIAEFMLVGPEAQQIVKSLLNQSARQSISWQISCTQGCTWTKLLDLTPHP